MATREQPECHQSTINSVLGATRKPFSANRKNCGRPYLPLVILNSRSQELAIASAVRVFPGPGMAQSADATATWTATKEAARRSYRKVNGFESLASPHERTRCNPRMRLPWDFCLSVFWNSTTYIKAMHASESASHSLSSSLRGAKARHFRHENPAHLLSMAFSRQHS
jgi:hypothetical protein